MQYILASELPRSSKLQIKSLQYIHGLKCLARKITYHAQSVATYRIDAIYTLHKSYSHSSDFPTFPETFWKSALLHTWYQFNADISKPFSSNNCQWPAFFVKDPFTNRSFSLFWSCKLFFNIVRWRAKWKVEEKVNLFMASK